MRTSEPNLRYMIEIIKDATLCKDWADDVSKMLTESEAEKTECPEYLWSFFDITGGHNYMVEDGEVQSTPWIQNQMSSKRYEKIMKRMDAFQPVEGGFHIDEGDEQVNEKMAVEDISRMNKYYDSYVQTTTWAGLQLFVHRTIRTVGKGEEEDNKYCFWPLSQPWVNHRPIDVSLVGEKGGFIDNLCNSPSVEWNSQQGFSIPYCVTDEKVDGSVVIDMEYMINSGESRTNEEEYVHEKNTNGAAGNVHCVSLKRESLLKCIDCLSVSSYYV
jgi:hypothetical protein